MSLDDLFPAGVSPRKAYAILRNLESQEDLLNDQIQDLGHKVDIIGFSVKIEGTPKEVTTLRTLLKQIEDKNAELNRVRASIAVAKSKYKHVLPREDVSEATK